MEELEIWKPVVGYEGLYEVSNLGRVKSLSRVYKSGRSHSLIKLAKEQILSEDKTKGGYIRISLSKDGNTKHCLAHRIVAEAFIPNPNNYPCINHLDRNRSNNRADNLEWCTHKQNLLYSPTRIAISESQLNGGHSKTVLQYTLDGEFIQEWPSAREISRQLGYAYSNIGACCRGIYHKAYGYVWCYKNSDK